MQIMIIWMGLNAKIGGISLSHMQIILICMWHRASISRHKFEDKHLAMIRVKVHFMTNLREREQHI
jgi:hypothetical protein